MSSMFCGGVLMSMMLVSSNDVECLEAQVLSKPVHLPLYRNAITNTTSGFFSIFIIVCCPGTVGYQLLRLGNDMIAFGAGTE